MCDKHTYKTLENETLSPKILSLVPGEKKTIEMTPKWSERGNVYYACAYMVWESSDEAVATVDANGEVTGVAAGKATIIFSTWSASDSKSDTCEVTVTAV